MIHRYLLILLVSLAEVNGLSQEKLKFALAEDVDPSVRVPLVEEAIVKKALNLAEKDVEEEAKFNAKHHVKRAASYHGNRKVRSEVWAIHKENAILERAVDILCSTRNLTREVGDHIVKRSPPRQNANFNALCQNRQFQCNRVAKFRNIDGSCNNLNNPDWGMAVVKLRRLLGPKYGDGFNSPRLAASGRALPLSRFVSTTVLPDIHSEHETVSHMFMQYGQFVNHDMQSTPHRTDLTNCCNNRNTADCLPLNIPRDDPQFGPARIGCMEFSRSIRACGNGVREQINQNTAFIDGSQIYGSSIEDARNLRTFQQGLLRTTNNGQNLPVNPNDDACTTQGTGRDFCFVAGDDRLNIQPGLSAVHTLFLREHNRIARVLRSMGPQFSDEQLYQETKRVVIAELESITYNEYLPILLGSHLMSQFELNLPKDGTATAYQSNVNPNIYNSFATAAFRFGHSQIQNIGQLANSRNGFALKDNYNNPTVIHRAGVDSVLVGSAQQKAQDVDNFMAEAVTNFLFKEPNNPFGLDLAAFNLERGREHGLPSYNDFRVFCELPRIRSFAELRNVFKDSVRAADAFQQAYAHVDDIDLFAGGIAETPVRGALVGPTFGCIIGMQFHRLLYGDRHFFTHPNQPGSFTPNERAMLSKRTLASVMCDNLRLDSIQQNAFLVSGQSNPVLACNQHPKIDFRIFF